MDVHAAVCQNRDDLAGREVSKLFRVSHCQHALALKLAQFVSGILNPCPTLVALIGSQTPALQRASAQVDGLAGPGLAGPGHDRLLTTGKDLSALCSRERERGGKGDGDSI